MSDKNIALIPMRGGSKSIPQKNIKPIAGKPLCCWAIEAALACTDLSQVFISTDCELIQDVAKQHFASAIASQRLVLVEREASLAEDATSTEEVIIDFVEGRQFDRFTLIQVTSPLVKSIDIKRSIELVANGYDSSLTVAPLKRFFWSDDGKPINYDIYRRPRRQDFKGSLVENGAVYTTTREALLTSKNRISGNIALVSMPEESFFELDEEADFLIIEQLLLRQNLASKSKIDAVVIDVDGTLTDGGMYYSADGEQLKKFNTVDAKGIELVRQLGTKVFILTAEDSPSVHARFSKVQVDEYQFGIKNKLPVLRDWATENSVSLSSILYIGDDLGDLEAMFACGHRACPANATPQIKQAAEFVASKLGGSGAVREILNEYFPI